MPAQSTPSTARTIRHCLFLVLFSLIVLAPGIAGLPATDRDEARYLQATKQMVASGDYVDIRFKDEPRYRKPAGIYWMQSAALLVSGDGENAPVWVNRSVSVASGIAAVVALYLLTASLFGARAGLIAGLGLAGIFMLGFEARIAKTDAALLAATLAAQAGLALVYVAARTGKATNPWHAWMFWIGLGAGMMIKGPITPGVAGLTILALALNDRLDIRWLRQLRPLRGVLIFLVIVLPWFIAISATSGLEFWKISIGKAFLSKVTSVQESHGAPPGYYFILFMLFMWPMGPLALKAGLHGLNRFRTDPRIAFALAWYLPFWLALEIAPTKLPHYILPVYPALLMLMGAFMAEDGERDLKLRTWQVWLMRIAWGGFAFVTLLLAAAIVAVPVYFDGAPTVAAIAAALLVLAAGWIASGLRLTLMPVVRVGGASLAAGLAVGLTAGWVLPSADKLWLSEAVVAKWHEVRLCDETPLVSTGYAEPSMVYLTSKDIVFAEPDVAASYIARDAQCAVVAVTAENGKAFLDALPGGTDSARPVGEVTAFYYTKGRYLTMTFYTAAADGSARP